MLNSKRVVVIGGGISGLACAFRLVQSGEQVLLLESEDHPGGLVGSVKKDGVLIERGPQSFQGTPSILELIKQVGMESELLTADPKAPRYVLQHGKLREIPMSPKALLTSSLLTASARWKIASEALRKTRPPTEEESVADFVRRKFGHEILEYLVAPFVSGVYAGDPEKLSLKAAFPTLEDWEREYGSILRGALKSRPEQRSGPPPLCSFRGGLGSLMRATAGKLGDNFRLKVRVAAVRRSGDTTTPQYEIRISSDGREDTILASAVVMAVPAYVASRLLAGVFDSLAHTLSGIAYAPVAVAGAVYYDRQIGRPINGFGFLVPRSENLRTLGTVWNSSLFPGRTQQGQTLTTSFVGGATDTSIVQKSEEEIAGVVQAENARVMGITGSPVASAVFRYPKALPQYNLGHGHVVAAIRDAERATPGLFFTGNYLEGPALGKCVEMGNLTAEAVLTYAASRAG
jgi:protoporphyrinogen/coproporphyrinogen III oxidase